MGYDVHDEPIIECPYCQAPMEKAEDHGIVIDVCDEHGIWLDAGELEDLLQRANLRQRGGPKRRAMHDYMDYKHAKAQHKMHKKMHKKHAKKDFFYWLAKKAF